MLEIAKQDQQCPGLGIGQGIDCKRMLGEFMDYGSIFLSDVSGG